MYNKGDILVLLEEKDGLFSNSNFFIVDKDLLLSYNDNNLNTKDKRELEEQEKKDKYFNFFKLIEVESGKKVYTLFPNLLYKKVYTVLNDKELPLNLKQKISNLTF